MPSITILTQYYVPETGAPQNRLHSLAMYLNKHDWDVRVVTALPSYPKSQIFTDYKGRYSFNEVIDGVRVHRRWIFVNGSRSVLSRLLNYFSFVFTSFFALIRLQKTNYIVCESPPLFLGITAVLIAKIKGSRLIFNVSDLWPESAEKLQIISSRSMLNLAYKLEEWIYKNSFLISGQTNGIVNNIKLRFPAKNVVWFPNGVDIDYFDKEHEDFKWRSNLGIASDDFVLLYAGIIGHAQGLEIILYAAEELKDLSIKFLIVGDGPEKLNLIKLANEKKLTNVIFTENQQKNKIPSLINTCDAYIVPLKKLELFMGAIPSKLFEPLALGKPILLGVDGEARELFIEEGSAGLYYEPENLLALSQQIKILFNNRSLAVSLGKQGQKYVRDNFDRNNIHYRFVENIGML